MNWFYIKVGLGIVCIIFIGYTYLKTSKQKPIEKNDQISSVAKEKVKQVIKDIAKKDEKELFNLIYKILYLAFAIFIGGWFIIKVMRKFI